MKKIICILLCLTMLSGLMTFASAEDSGVVTGEYRYGASIGFLTDSDPARSFRYSDDYFRHTGYQYDHELAKMTMDLCCSADASMETDWAESNRNFIDLMRQCGFTDMDANRYITEGPTTDSIGVNMASRQVDDYTLLAVAVRGHNYQCEWASNFTAGKTGDHQGFSEARDQVLDYIREYIAAYHVTGKLKIWLTGYSRSAVTANLVGGAIDQGFDFGEGVTFDRKDLYCYTFEAPQGTADENCRDALYYNIHNIINVNDLVPLVSLSAWGHSRFGIDYHLPCRQLDGDYYWKLKPAADSILCGTEQMTLGLIPLDLIDTFRYVSLDPLTTLKKQNVTQIEFYDELISVLTDELFPSRESYVDNAQNDLREFGAVVLGGTRSFSDVLQLFAQKFLALDNLSELYNALTEGCGKNCERAKALIEKLFMEALAEAGHASYDSEQAEVLVRSMVETFFRLFRAAPDTMLTTLTNLLPILNAHFPEIGRIWLDVTPAEFFLAQSGNAGEEPHTFADAWSFDETSHWHADTCGHGLRADEAAHSDENGDGLCDVCNAALCTVKLNVTTRTRKTLLGLAPSYTYTLDAIVTGGTAKKVQYSLDGGFLWFSGTEFTVPVSNYSFRVRVFDSTGTWTYFTVKNGTDVTAKGFTV